jgi:hypothetical protein
MKNKIQDMPTIKKITCNWNLRIHHVIKNTKYSKKNIKIKKYFLDMFEFN